MADQYKDLSHTAAQIDSTIDGFSAHTADTVSHVTVLDRENWDSKVDSADLEEETTARESADSALRTDLDTKLSAANVYRGTEITSSSDLNDLMTYGTYYCSASSIASSLSNCPVTGSGFIMQVYSTGNRMQLIYPVSASNNKIYWRCYTSGAWQQWFMIEGTAVL